VADESKKILNKEQIEAIEYGQGPLLIIAGAGTGKTTVVTERIKYLITKENISPSEILALTFTEKASREMEARVDEALPLGYANMWISTFHSFGDRILRDEGLNIGLNPGYRLMTEAESIQLFRKNLFKFELDYFRPLGNPTKFIDGILKHFSRLKDEDVEPNQYLGWVKDQRSKIKDQNPDLKLNNENEEEFKKYLELANTYKIYEEIKQKEGLMDFSDLISNVVKLFRQRKNVLKKYQDKFKYILVDEFQDTNYSQYVLTKLLAPPQKNPNLTVVGDDNQCLPADTKISLFDGEIRIDQVKVGDFVLTAVGKGHTSCSKVAKIFKNKKIARLLTFTLESGEKLTVTDNHKMFCYIPKREKRREFYYVYLMRQKKYGWRLGITNDLASRLRLESHADGILAIGSYKNDQEARYYEALYSAKYGLPTVPFSPRERQAISGERLDKLFENLNTKRGARMLAANLGVDLDSWSVVRGGVVRGESERIKINLEMCYRNHRSKTHIDGFVGNPAVYHMVGVETSSNLIINKLRRAGYKLTDAKKGKRFRFLTADLSEAWEIADKLVLLTDGILEKKITVGTENYQHRSAVITPASNVFPGNYLPILEGKNILYKRVVLREEKEKELFVYDLEIEKTHNFIANGVVIHNSIYKFRGAAISNILQFIKDYSKTKSIVLNKNYRSSQIILDTSYKLIKNNDPDTLEASLGISKKLQKMREIEEIGPEFLFADRVEDEAEKVADKIKELMADNPQTLARDFAILVRANNHAEPFIRALNRKQIPYQFLGPGMLFRQPEIKDLIAYLSVLYNFEDSVAMYRLLSMDIFEIRGRELVALVNLSKKLNLSLFEICERISDKNDNFGEPGKTVKKPEIGEKELKTIVNLVDMIYQHMDLIKKETAGQILYYFLQDTGMIKTLINFKTVKEEKRAQNIAKFFDKLKTYEADHEDSSVYAVVDYINLSMELGESPLASDIDWTENDAVNILTVHSAKGLEFPVVFLVNLVSQRFPTTERREQIPIPEELIKEILPKGDFHLEEERRLFYVGMTRAMDRLFLTAANYYGEGKREKKLSPFVEEALDPAFAKATAGEGKENQLSIFDFKPANEIQNSKFKIQNSPVTYLSYSQIETFNTCPLQYKFRHILRIPTPPSAALSFGDTIHQTMRDFYQSAVAGQNPKKEDLLKILEENWSHPGYPSRAHEERFRKEGEKILNDFYDKSYDPKTLPIALEQVFSIKIDPTLKVGGRIDRIDQAKKGIEIIDYKTGKSSIKKDVEKDLQMTIYTMAAADGTLTYMGILQKTPKPEEVKVSFYFFDNQEKLSSFRKIEDFERVKQELIKKAEEISNSDFSPTPGKHCDFCEYKLLCEAWS